MVEKCSKMSKFKELIKSFDFQMTLVMCYLKTLLEISYLKNISGIRSITHCSPVVLNTACFLLESLSQACKHPKELGTVWVEPK